MKYTLTVEINADTAEHAKDLLDAVLIDAVLYREDKHARALLRDRDDVAAVARDWVNLAESIRKSIGAGMTYHPIDKPTEPGWYWWRYPGTNKYSAEEIACDRDGTLRQENQRDGGLEDIPPDWGTWYGPKIEMPSPHPQPAVSDVAD